MPQLSKAVPPWRAVASLWLVSLCWGASFPLLKFAVQQLSPALLVVGRFALAALLLLPCVGLRRLPLRLWRAAVLLGVLHAGIYGLVSYALQFSASPRVGFLVGSSVVLLPWLRALGWQARLRARHLYTAALSCLGLWTLLHFRWQDLQATDGLVLLAALLFAGATLVVQAVGAPQPAAHVVWQLLGVQFATTAACALPVLLWQMQPLSLSHLQQSWAAPPWTALLALLYGALVPSIMCQGLVMRYQPQVGAQLAATIFPLQGVFNYAIAALCFGGSMDLQGLLGGACMLLAALLV